MLCYWGAQVREGFGLLQPDHVRHADFGGIRFMFPKSEIQDLSAGRSFVGFIRDGKVSVMRLRPEDNHHDGRLKQLQIKNDKITSVECGDAGAVLLAHGGKVLIMDKSTMCNPLKGLDNRKVIQITCGDQHSMALTHDGQLFVWGENSHGQLGLKEGQSGTLTAQHVQSLSGIPLAQISAGGDHSFALSLSGAVFGWGKNNAGQLGLGDTKDRHVPTVVSSLTQKKTVLISCGGEHTATLSKGGTVFTFGSGRFGQLGHNSFRDEHHPRVVAELWGSEVSQVTCGRNHTLVLVESSKLIYSFGCGMQGQLGNGQMCNQSVPLPVKLPTESNHAYVVGKLISGENHSFALCFKELGNDTATPRPNQIREILTLDYRMIEQWVNESDPKSWPKIKNEINKVFSSTASLNGSFLKTSCDEHYQTSVELCGLDFDLIKQSFAKLSENKMVLSEVVNVVQRTLLPSLNTNPAGVEALRLYLLLPELINRTECTECTETLASKILQLNPAALKVLENYWSKLPDDCLKGLVVLFRKESAKLIYRICHGKMNILKRLQKCVQVLQMLYKVRCITRNDMITNRDFIIHEINDLIDTLQATDVTTVCLWDGCEDLSEIFKLRDYYIGTLKVLVNFPFVADTISKQQIFTYLQNPFLEGFPEIDLLNFHRNKLHINRQTILKDTLFYLKIGIISFSINLQVQFVGENGVDQRGLSAEFFSLLSRSILTWDKRLLEVCENFLIWFRSDCTHEEVCDVTDFYYIGIMCGMALHNHHYMSINFPLALFKKLLQLSPTFSDLEELSPVEARSLKNLLEEDEEVVDELFLDFTVKGQELIPNGSQIPVTKINRQKYVDMYVDFVFNKSVKNRFEQFSRGFSEGCPVNAWKMFHPEELRELFHGSREYAWKDLRQCATYERCSPSDELIMNFWTVFFELSEENKKKFLLFMYGTDCVPVGGLSKLSLKIVQLNLPEPDDRFPEAQICFGILHLPKYSNTDILRNKLMHAINFCEVFGQSPLKGLDNRNVIQITCGDQHSMALTQDGQLFVWGENSHGQLGLKEGQSGTLTAQHVQSLSGIPLAQISAGGDHSFALSLSGAVFGWGKNNSGQLGLGDTKDRHVPTVVNCLNQKKTVMIACGGEHTASISKGGTVFTFGSGRFGQLGHNSFRDEHHPRVVAELWGSEVSQVTCGRNHTLVLVDSSKLIYSFGCGMQGQLGNGQMCNQSVPLPVKLPTESNNAYAIKKLTTGENHSFALFNKEVGNASAKHKPNPGRSVLTLDEIMIDRWMTECDSKAWKTKKNEIKKVFSSAACLNGSFLKTSCDKHYQTSVELCGLDFDLIKQSFVKLSENERVISKVVNVVQRTLLPSLNKNPAGVEALRLYLLLPELIRVLQKPQRTKLTEDLASKILQLSPAALKVLENYWFALPDDYLKGLVKLFRKESADLIGSIADGQKVIPGHLQNFLQVLLMLYKVFCRTHKDITNRDFIIHEINDLLDMLQVTNEDLTDMSWWLDQRGEINALQKLRDYYVENMKILVDFPFVADTASKQRIFFHLQDLHIQNIGRIMFSVHGNMLHINRQSLLEDTLQYLRQDIHSFSHLLKVEFVGEIGVDERGLSAEFFSILSQSILTWEKQLLEVCENSVVWFNPDCIHKENCDVTDFYYIGIMCGMALYNHHYMSINFPLALFKKLLQQSPTLSDLEELSPVEARSLKNLLEEDEEVVDELFLDFTVKGQELIPNGCQIPVTIINREKYVDLYVDFVFNKAVTNQFEQFSRGFSKGFPLSALRMFHPEELKELFHGSPEYKWKDLLQCATYERCSPSDELIMNFWTVFFELSEENKKKFLLFMYGTDCVPVGGLSKRSLKIVKLNHPDPDDRFPEAQICFDILHLPKYSNIDILRKKLIHAINYCEVFGRV
ncbi:probable E3 ubiquitin-protein ligase HERC3 [Xyrauchen texanus]|uniref:probable E3 ubiquitin-protein ligase HERC3 n=1 Tax=Xyrauchen texanus TaxID=154827 RepID=UPI00224190B0|nr:probable E3 ubiquitin-protein ligase HERC3 [Xyrauchen texanus]